MNRLAGIVIAIIGLLVALLSVLKVVPGTTSTGVFMVLLGALMIGLSFVPKPEGDGDGGGEMSTPSTLVNIFFSPTEVFRNLRWHPRWLVALLIMSVLSAIYLNAFMYRLTPERVTNYTIDKTLEMPMLANNEQARQQIEASRAQAIADNKNPVLKLGQSVNSFIGQVFLYAFFALIFFLFALAMGGRLNYWQAFSAAVYAAFPVAVIRFALNMLLLFVKDPIDIHPVLGQGSLIQDNLNFLANPSESPVLYTLLSMFSLLAFYWLWLSANGLKNTGEKVSSTIAWTATLTVFMLGVLLSVVMSFMFSGFMK
ncbi:MAG TPA: YIP1 family protein [Pyrinomonadaceae bacterium]|jgi:hypothetical protein